MRYIPLFITIIFLTAGLAIGLTRGHDGAQTKPPVAKKTTLINLPTPTVTLTPLPEKILLSNDYHIFQSFNNCGPAAFSMALSYYGISASQETLGETLRPYQIPGGNNDDKSVTLDELEEKSKEYGLVPFHRPAGTPETIKRFLAAGIPVITRTWLHTGEDIGHYRIIKGYDDTTSEFIQDDSLQGKNLRYSYDEFDELWQAFSYEYLVLVPKEKEKLAKTILGDNADEKISWEKALQLSRTQATAEPESVYPVFNEVVALTRLGRFEEATRSFESIENRLSFRMLWYQIEPIIAYQKIKNYDKVFAMTDAILNNQNRAFSELYFIRGQMYEEQGDSELAKAEYEKAALYNRNFKPAIDALQRISS